MGQKPSVYRMTYERQVTHKVSGLLISSIGAQKVSGLFISSIKSVGISLQHVMGHEICLSTSLILTAFGSSEIAESKPDTFSASRAVFAKLVSIKQIRSAEPVGGEPSLDFQVKHVGHH